MIKKKYLYGVMLALWFVVDLIVTIMPSDNPATDSIFGTDKLLHIIKFIFFIILIYQFLHHINYAYYVKLMIYIPLLFFPFVDESMQIFVKSRSFSHFDIAADYIGIFLGLVISVAIRLIHHKKSLVNEL